MLDRVVWASVAGLAMVCVACASLPHGETTSRRELEQEERSACAGVPAETRDADPFPKELVEAVAELSETRPNGKQPFRQVTGAEITLRATPGETRLWLSRVLRCHVARHATTMLPDRDVDPLAVAHPGVTVGETETGFAVRIRADDDDQALQILARARSLLDAGAIR